MKTQKGLAYDFKKGSSKKDVTIVFIPGSGCTRKIFADIINLMDCDCYSIDLPGHGESDDTGYSIENYISSISDFVSILNNVVIVGHSLGGTICLGLASKNISSVKGCVLLSAAASFPKIDKDFLESVHKGDPNLNYLMKCCGGSQEIAQKALATFDQRKQVLIEDFLIDEVVNLKDCLSKINIPTQIFVGDDEILALVEYSELIYKEVKNSKLTVYPNQRHLLFLNAKEKTLEIIHDTINQIIK